MAGTQTLLWKQVLRYQPRVDTKTGTKIHYHWLESYVYLHLGKPGRVSLDRGKYNVNIPRNTVWAARLLHYSSKLGILSVALRVHCEPASTRKEYRKQTIKAPQKPGQHLSSSTPPSALHHGFHANHRRFIGSGHCPQATCHPSSLPCQPPIAVTHTVS